MPVDFLIITLLFFFIFSVLFLLYGLFYALFISIIPAFFHGAVFAKSSPKIVQKMIFLADVKPGQKAVDLGSGDGRLVIAMAKSGAEAHGYEINPFLVWLSRKNIKKEGLSGRAFIHWGNFWQADFSEFDFITVYGISYIMKELEAKLKKELKAGSRVVSNYFIFSNWPHSKRENDIYLYLKSTNSHEIMTNSH